MHTIIIRYIRQKVIEGEHYPENDSLSLLLFMGETKKKQLTWLSTKPRGRKYIQIMQNAKNAIVFKVNTC